MLYFNQKVRAHFSDILKVNDILRASKNIHLLYVGYLKQCKPKKKPKDWNRFINKNLLKAFPSAPEKEKVKNLMLRDKW